MLPGCWSLFWEILGGPVQLRLLAYWWGHPPPQLLLAFPQFIHWLGARICIWLSCLLDFLEGSHARLLSYHSISISVMALCLPFLDLNPNLGLSMDILSLMFFSSFVPAVPSNRNNSGSKIMHIGQQLHLIPVPPLEVDSQVPPCLYRALYPRSLPLSPGSLSPPRSLEHVRWTSIDYLLRLSISIFSTGPQGFSPTPHPSQCLIMFPLPFSVPAPTQVPPSFLPHDCFLLSPKWDWDILICNLELFNLL